MITLQFEGDRIRHFGGCTSLCISTGIGKSIFSRIRMCEKVRIVVKLGTSTLTDGTRGLSISRMKHLVDQMSALRSSEDELLLVSSGAIATGREWLELSNLPKDIPAKQMLAAVGQPRLMNHWSVLFAEHDLKIAQVLLTKDDFRSRQRYLNARNTLLALLQHGIIPVINENDTVATDEIEVGDNDNLSALVSNLIDANLLIMLTDQKGLFTSDPNIDSEAELVKLVDDPDIAQMYWSAAGESGDLGVGGMHTKLQAADLARRSGATVVIASGSVSNGLLRIVAGEDLGTRFLPTVTAVESRKRFILSGGQAGHLLIDAGAAQALKKGRSLLPVGLLESKGNFDRGETVAIFQSEDREIARGLVNYDARDCEKICGHKSDEIEKILGYFYGEEIIHRNNLVLL